MDITISEAFFGDDYTTRATHACMQKMGGFTGGVGGLGIAGKIGGMGGA